ncbi:hypothetical protein D3C87_1711240 [compost metagenome]
MTFELERSKTAGAIKSAYNSAVDLLATFSTTRLFGSTESVVGGCAQAPSITAKHTNDSPEKARRMERTPAVLNMVRLPEWHDQCCSTGPRSGPLQSLSIERAFSDQRNCQS